MNYSLASYRAIIECALVNGYTFAPFTPDGWEAAKRIHLRHDVDYSLEMALDLARVNAELGVRGTFCVLLRSQIYNLLSHQSLRVVQQIHDLGQILALHVPAPPGPYQAAAIAGWIRRDFEFVRSNLPPLAPVFAWHNPTPALLDWSRSLVEIGGLVNTYAARFTHEIAYYSDSNMRHSASDFLQVLGDQRHDRLQLLLHPLYWVAGGNTMADTFATTWGRVIRERERDFLTNPTYAATFPEGMPEALLRSFADGWHRAAGMGARQ